MSQILDHELAAYVLGDAPPELRSRIEEKAGADEDFAAELSAFAALGAVDTTLPTLRLASPSEQMPRRRSVLRRIAIAAGILLATAGVGWGGYELLRTPPLLEDSFSSRTIANTKWHAHLGRKGVSAADGTLHLLNRGSVVTRKEFEGPIEITLDWKWTDHAQWPLYSEVFTVCLRTSGVYKPEHAYEILDGVKIEFNAGEGRVRADRAGVPDPSLIKAAALDSTPFPAGTWHHIRITDDGRSIAVYVEGPSIDPRYKKEPVLTVAVPEGLTGKRIAIFNREYVAGTNHESQVDNVKVWGLQ